MAALAVAAGSCSPHAGEVTTSGAQGEAHTFVLHIRVSGNGAVVPGGLGRACTDDCSFRALRGKTVELRALEREDVFHRWRGRCGQAPTCRVKMSSDVHVRAEFGLDRYEPAWVMPFTSSECVLVNHVAAEQQVLFAGSFTGMATLGGATLTSGTEGDAVISALRRENGAIEWVRQFGGSSSDHAAAPAASPAHGIVAGLSVSDGARVGASLVTAREEIVAWIDDDGGAIARHAVVSGTIEAIARLDDGSAVVLTDRAGNAHVTRFDAIAGAPRWSTDLTATQRLSAGDLAIGPGGDVFVVGQIAGSPRFGSFSRSSASSRASRRPFVARLDQATGSVKLARWVDVDASHTVHRLASDGRQLIATGASNRDAMPAFVIAMSLDGSVRWQRHYRGVDGESSVFISALVAWPAGAIVAGTIEGELELRHRRVGQRRTTSSFILELSPDGDELWSYAMPAAAGELRAVARDADGDLYVVGGFRDPFTFGGKTVAPHPSGRPCSSAYVAKLVRTGDRSPTAIERR
ncbi:MAG TPA: hypothetical protein VFU21_14255 [Kofleriaceae bacterium]|nr:hypothetical protein [Kofleriaceae bacterium]